MRPFLRFVRPFQRIYFPFLKMKRQNALSCVRSQEIGIHSAERGRIPQNSRAKSIFLSAFPRTSGHYPVSESRFMERQQELVVRSPVFRKRSFIFKKRPADLWERPLVSKEPALDYGRGRKSARSRCASCGQVSPNRKILLPEVVSLFLFTVSDREIVGLRSRQQTFVNLLEAGTYFYWQMSGELGCGSRISRFRSALADLRIRLEVMTAAGRTSLTIGTRKIELKF